jgi:diacylglycerol kinase (ATP)
MSVLAVPHTKVIVNPVAGASSTRRKWPRISRLLKHIGLSFDYEYTEGVGHAIELARAAVSDGYPYLVAVGGDGTINEVANGILHSTNSGTASLGGNQHRYGQ